MSLITHLQQLWPFRGGKSRWQVSRDHLWAQRSFYINILLRICGLMRININKSHLHKKNTFTRYYHIRMFYLQDCQHVTKNMQSHIKRSKHASTCKPNVYHRNGNYHTMPFITCIMQNCIIQDSVYCSKSVHNFKMKHFPNYTHTLIATDYGSLPQSVGRGSQQRIRIQNQRPSEQGCKLGIFRV